MIRFWRHLTLTFDPESYFRTFYSFALLVASRRAFGQIRVLLLKGVCGYSSVNLLGVLWNEWADSKSLAMRRGRCARGNLSPVAIATSI